MQPEEETILIVCGVVEEQQLSSRLGISKSGLLVVMLERRNNGATSAPHFLAREQRAREASARFGSRLDFRPSSCWCIIRD